MAYNTMHDLWVSPFMTGCKKTQKIPPSGTEESSSTKHAQRNTHSHLVVGYVDNFGNVEVAGHAG